MLIIHQYHMSPFNMKIQRMLNYKGVAFTEKFWGLTERKNVRKINPTLKLPALQHGDKLVCDSTDMAWYIEQQFPEPRLIPENSRLRGLMHALEDWADESLYFYEMHLRLGTPGNQQRNLPRLVEHESSLMRWLLLRGMPKGIAKITATQGVGRKDMRQLLVDTRRHVQAVADLVENDPWLLGAQLSLADLAVHSMLTCFRDATEAAAIIDEYPGVTEWMQRLESATDHRAQQ